MSGYHTNIREYFINEMPELLGTQFLLGIVKNVIPEQNKADILISGVNTSRLFQNIDIFYHVPKDDGGVSIENGGYAFKKEDLVIMYKQDDNLKVIGFPDGLHPAGKLRVLFNISGQPYDLFYDLQNMELFILDKVNQAIIKTNLSGENKITWVPQFNFGAGTYNLIDIPVMLNLEKDLTGNKLYFSGKHNFLPSMEYWDENCPYGGYDEITYPVTLYPYETITATYRIRFDTSLDFTCYNMDTNQAIGTGSVSGDFYPGYFMIDSRGWQGSFAPGDMIDFRTHAASESSYRDSIFNGTFNMNIGFHDINDFYPLNPAYFHYCNEDNALYVIGESFVNGSMYKNVLRRYSSLTDFTEKDITPAEDHTYGHDYKVIADFCHDCGNNVFYINAKTIQTKVNSILQMPWAGTINDIVYWNPGWLPGNFDRVELSGIAFNPTVLKLYFSASVLTGVQYKNIIYKSGFLASSFDEIIYHDIPDLGRLKCYDNSLFFTGMNGNVFRYKE